MELTSKEFQDHCESCAGYCMQCEDITKESDTEPDANNYLCPVCGTHNVMGMENAMVSGFIDIVDE